MLLPPYSIEELEFAYCYHVYLRWHTYRRRPVAHLHQLSAAELQALHPEIHLLELECSDVEIALLASLKPSETVSAAARKLKGAASKCLRKLLGPSAPQRILGGGYFAQTAGSSRGEVLDRYLDTQSEHHGYTQPNPPVFVRTWPVSDAEEPDLQASHSYSLVHYHLSLATCKRRGVFVTTAAESVTDCWEALCPELGIRLRKVAFLADHVHIAVRSRPTVAPSQLALRLLNAAQDVIKADFDDLLVKARIPRLWMPSAYIATYGELASDQVRAYLRRWREASEGAPA